MRHKKETLLHRHWRLHRHRRPWRWPQSRLRLKLNRRWRHIGLSGRGCRGLRRRIRRGYRPVSGGRRRRGCCWRIGWGGRINRRPLVHGRRWRRGSHFSLGGLVGYFGEIARHLLLAGLQLGDAGLQRLDLLIGSGEIACHRWQLLRRIRWRSGGRRRYVCGRATFRWALVGCSSCCRRRNGRIVGRRGLRGQSELVKRQRGGDRPLRRPGEKRLLGGVTERLPAQRGGADSQRQKKGGNGAERPPAERALTRGHIVVNGGGTKRRIDRYQGRWRGWR